MAQFMKPHLFGEAQREDILRSLTRMRVGDEEGRRIFVFALEYELAQFEAQREQTDEEAVTAAALQASPAVAPVGKAAGALLGALQNLTPDAEALLLEALAEGDSFRRRHDAAYLEALRSELHRLRDAADVEVAAAAPPEPSLTAAERRFLKTLAKAYHDCFETPATADPKGPFARMIAKLLPPLGIDVAVSTADLEELLAPGQR
jgi:hypothetical protein